MNNLPWKWYAKRNRHFRSKVPTAGPEQDVVGVRYQIIRTRPEADVAISGGSKAAWISMWNRSPSPDL
jgi:hypothetical protein